ncbi:MAG TPA: 2-oxoacid:acceptor oxidoreductase family protein [Candidatus Limnocylindrales bacterium]|nr:2-oxoacid:acceptor oxidoreductase family protein [Candidatus Limnocylindrales bacterium]
MEHAVVISGFGGQGLLFAGQVLAEAAMLEGREVLWIPSYGPEMRGGSAACTVIVGDEPIGSPVVDRADVVVALTRPSFEKYGGLVERGGLLVVDGSLVDAPTPPGVELLAPACTRLAREAGDDRLVSIVALGAVLARRPIVGLSALRTALERVVGAKHPELLAADLVALDSGLTVAA